MFLNQQSESDKARYFGLLKAMGSLSRLFSDNDQAPYLYYRSHENIFCKAFGAENLSRSDYTVDALKDSVGIGLKTFIHKSSQFEKVAEFNKLMPEYERLEGRELVKTVVEARNKRIDFANNLLGTATNVYHCVSRKPNRFDIYEVEMSPIDTGAISIVGNPGSAIVGFRSGVAEYKFNRSKSTLFQKFIPDPSKTESVSIRLVEDPYQMALDFYSQNTLDEITDTTSIDTTNKIVLPMYSPRTKRVNEKSGLNGWNAGGRPRHPDEVYIPIPRQVHVKHPGFFPPREQDFNIRLPGDKKLKVKVCQENDKALMSNPNRDLGHWLLREVLKLRPRELLTYERLLILNIDSVSIEKNDTGKYRMDFQSVGSYEEFMDI